MLGLDLQKEKEEKRKERKKNREKRVRKLEGERGKEEKRKWIKETKNTRSDLVSRGNFTNLPYFFTYFRYKKCLNALVLSVILYPS